MFPLNSSKTVSPISGASGIGQNSLLLNSELLLQSTNIGQDWSFGNFRDVEVQLVEATFGFVVAKFREVVAKLGEVEAELEDV